MSNNYIPLCLSLDGFRITFPAAYGLYFHSTVKGMEGSTQNKEDLAWDEKDISDFEVLSDTDSEKEEELGEVEGKKKSLHFPVKSTRFWSFPKSL